MKESYREHRQSKSESSYWIMETRRADSSFIELPWACIKLCSAALCTIKSFILIINKPVAVRARCKWMEGETGSPSFASRDLLGGEFSISVEPWWCTRVKDYRICFFKAMLPLHMIVSLFCQWFFLCPFQNNATINTQLNVSIFFSSASHIIRKICSCESKVSNNSWFCGLQTKHCEIREKEMKTSE